ncbi:MAG: hypothetical protein HY211_05480 [Candidatus Omnitrophica bacterium]|nr:hypothetical protein [Candidatus Omnitrophota bacterium]
MSLIADALRKANISFPVSSPSPRPPKPVWTYLLAGLFGLGLILLAHSLIRFPALPPASASSQTSAAPSAFQPIGLNLLRAAESQWRLNGIVRGGDGKPLALINGQVVAEGQPIQGAKVVRVASNEVDLETDGKIKTLKLR